MDELRAAEAVRYLASQYASMVFVAEQLDRIGSLKGQIDSLAQRHDEASRDLDEITAKVQAAQRQREEVQEAHRLSLEAMAKEYSEQSAALQGALEEQRVRQNLEISARAQEAEAEAQRARDAHQVHMVELTAQLNALGARIAEAAAHADAEEARRDRAQEAVNKLQASIAAIKIEGVE